MIPLPSMKRLALPSLAVLVLACGGAGPSAPAGGSGPRTPARTAPMGRSIAGAPARVEPLGFGAQAGAPDRALILGTDTGGTWLPLARPAITVLARPPQPPLDAVGPLWLTVWVQPAPAGSPVHRDDARYQRVLAEPGRPAAWAALQATAALLNKNLTELRYVAVPALAAGPLADQPAAGAWLAGVFLASLTGVPIRAEEVPGAASAPAASAPAASAPATASMTAAGPAPAASAPAATGLLLPDGAVLSRAPGGSAIHDLRDIYTRLTGRTLPAPAPVPARAMAVSEAWQRRLSARFPAWRGFLAASWAHVLQLAGPMRLPPALDRLARAARQQAQAAETLHAQGKPLAAYDRVMAAAARATALAALQDTLGHVRGGNIPAARARLRALAVAAAERLHEARQVAGARVPITLDQHIRLMAAHQWILRSAGMQAAAGQMLAEVEQAFDALAPRAGGAGTGTAPAGPSAASRRAPGPLGADTDRAVERARPAAMLLARAERSARQAMDMLAPDPAHDAPAAPAPASGTPAAPAPASATPATPAPASGTPAAPAPAYACDADAVRHLALAHAAASATGLRAAEHTATGHTAAGDAALLPGHAPELPPALRTRAQRMAVARIAIDHGALRARTDSAGNHPPEHQPCRRAVTALAAAMLAQVELGLVALQDELEPHTGAPHGARAGMPTGTSTGTRTGARILEAVLARAERKAREHARAAEVATGRIPSLARLEYALARQAAARARMAAQPRRAPASGQGVPPQRPNPGAGARPAADPVLLTRAIEHYWLASMYARAAVMLARNAARPTAATATAP